MQCRDDILQEWTAWSGHLRQIVGSSKIKNRLHTSGPGGFVRSLLSEFQQLALITPDRTNVSVVIRFKR
jgi:hypothetical protein